MGHSDDGRRVAKSSPDLETNRRRKCEDSEDSDIGVIAYNEVERPQRKPKGPPRPADRLAFKPTLGNYNAFSGSRLAYTPSPEPMQTRLKSPSYSPPNSPATSDGQRDDEVIQISSDCSDNALNDEHNIINQTFNGERLENLSTGALKQNAGRYGNAWLISLYDQWTDRFRNLTTPAVQGTNILEYLMRLEYNIRPHNKFNANAFSSDLIQPSLDMLMSDLCEEKRPCCIDSGTGQKVLVCAGKVVYSLLVHGNGYDTRGYVPPLGLIDLPPNSSLGVQRCKLRMPQDYTGDWATALPGPGEIVNTHSYFMPAGSVMDWQWRSGGALEALLHADSHTATGPRKLWIFAPNTSHNRKLLHRFIFNVRPHEDSSRIIPELEGVTYLLVTGSSRDTAAFIPAGGFKCALTFELSGHVTFSVYDVEQLETTKSVIEWEITNLTNRTQDDAGRTAGKRLWDDLKNWLKLCPEEDQAFIRQKLERVRNYFYIFET
ncbi:hypothetical protein CALVIDRAFT_532101 [Calocera viscosa TUFC12733]|uniref:Uncharacterized protein n=1 Tax=Calocera viscosa (strain TUFC12733) TaxID=1330018 RepID=A0A167FEQ4_CALVF|nr:hypothetical protein CALVIDRAFT_532101 [Calocera viscosa TUFC12733]